MPIGHKIFLAQFDAIKNIASKESCVFVGRCADYVLANDKDLLSVFIHSNMDSKITRVMEKLDIKDANKAKDLIIKTDKQRASYYNSYSNMKWGDAKTYNLTIDSSLLGIEGTADLIVDIARNKK